MSVSIPNTTRLAAGFIPDDLPVKEVLFEGEVPVVYISEDSTGRQLLAYLADENSEGVFTLLASVGKRTLKDLETGLIGVRDALELGGNWLHRKSESGSEVWSIDVADLPDDHLPRRAFRLRQEQEIVFSTRAIGQQIAPGKIPASVVAFLAENTRKAFKTLLDFRFDNKQEGRPSDEHRANYDLPVLSFRFASFEIDFAAPDATLFVDDVHEAAKMLGTGLSWAAGVGELPEDQQEREVMLKAALLLTPPASGPISEIQIDGRWLEGSVITLDRHARTRVRQAMRAPSEESVRVINGLLEEADFGRLTCTLRYTDDGKDRRAQFSEELSDSIQLLLQQRVTIAGTEKGERLEIAIIVPQAPDRSLSTEETEEPH